MLPLQKHPATQQDQQYIKHTQTKEAFTSPSYMLPNGWQWHLCQFFIDKVKHKTANSLKITPTTRAKLYYPRMEAEVSKPFLCNHPITCPIDPIPSYLDFHAEYLLHFKQCSHPSLKKKNHYALGLFTSYSSWLKLPVNTRLPSDKSLFSHSYEKTLWLDMINGLKSCGWLKQLQDNASWFCWTYLQSLTPSATFFFLSQLGHHMNHSPLV